MPALTENPTGLELEDFVAAHLAARGRFVEIGVTARDPIDILELDVVWTDYDAPGAPRHPVEVKSGDWGLGDLFKFYGWSRYLDLEPGWLFCRQPLGRVDPAILERLCARLGITFCNVPDLNRVPELFAGLGMREPRSEWLPELWRFSFWVQRRMLRSLPRAIESGTCPGIGRLARNYEKLILHSVFFEKDVRARLANLMEAHWDHPKLALAAAAESAGLGVHPDDPPQSEHFREALFEGRHFPVQACLYLEHRARLGILKTAVDYLLARRAGVLPPHVVRVLGHELDMDTWELADSFRSVVSRLDEFETAQQLPSFWQTFVLSWGGFFLEDRIETEYEALSAETGMPLTQLEAALQIWDDLFPIEGSWVMRPGGDSRRLLKLMPAVLRGIGAYRRLRSANLEEYRALGFTDDTARRLVVDHNSVVRLLDGGEDQLVL